MKKYITALAIFAALAIVAVLYVGRGRVNVAPGVPGLSTSGNEEVANAFKEQKSNVQVMGEGVVTKILPDDRDGGRHQRFILSVGSGQSLLVAHNIDLAPRLTSLELGDKVAFKGIYEWNPKGGTIHWTHRDPTGRHQAGWLKHNGETFQ